MHVDAEGLDGPPRSDEGEIVEVEDGRCNRGYQNDDTKACEHCDEPVPIDEPHIEAWVRVAGVVGHMFYQPVFCSETCWAAWATVTENPT